MPPKRAPDAGEQDEESTVDVARSRPGKRAIATDERCGPGSGKRRLAYAPRACDSCRRRKGRCDGKVPCDYCAGRGQACHYSLTPSDWRSVLGDVPTTQPSSNAPLGHVEHMLLSLQKKLDYLTAIVRQHLRENDHEAQTSHAQDDLGADRPLAFVSNCDTGAQRSRSLQHDDKTINVKQGNAFSDAGNSSHATSATTRTTYSGYMSPDCSFQLAQDKLLRDSDRVTDRGRRSDIGFADQNLCNRLSYSISDSIEWSASHNGGRHASPSSIFTCLVELPLRIPLAEALRLIDMYEQLVGERYPFLEVTCLKEKAETWYAWATGLSAGIDDPLKSCPLDEDDSLITLLVICITLAAEVAFAKPIDSKELYYALEKSIQSRILSPVSSMKDVIIILLSAHYHYFRGIIRTSWRLCGIAGSMMMELGLHDAEVVKNVLGSDQERSEAAVIAGTVIALDHQYSAVVGLPTHYKTASFSPELLSAVHTPYLKAMIPFLHISEMVSTMITDALENGSFDDGDAFELVNFQIEQWRRKALSTHAPILLQRAYCSHDNLPSWSLLIYLRANSVKNMLLRLFFVLSGSRSAAERQVKPALDLVIDSVETLVELDQHTTFYRNQHAHFQHMLSGACALLFLVVTFIERHPKTGCTEQLDTVGKIRQVFKSAVALSRAYSGIFTAAETLLRRLEDMVPILDRLSKRSKELCSDSMNPSQSVTSPVAQTKQGPGSTGQKSQIVDNVHRESAVADATRHMQLPLHDANNFLTPNMVEGMPWPEQSLSCAKSNLAPMRQTCDIAAAASFVDPLSSTAPTSMTRWLTTNADSMLAPVQQWSFDGEEDHFHSWSDT